MSTPCNESGRWRRRKANAGGLRIFYGGSKVRSSTVVTWECGQTAMGLVDALERRAAAVRI